MLTTDPRDPLDTALDWLLQIQQHPEDEALREQLAVWLASDAAHPAAFRQAQRAWQVSGALAPQATAGRPATVTPLRPRRTLRRTLQAASAIAACCLLVLLVQTLYPAWHADLYTAKAERKQLQLPDGSQLTLDAQSAVRLDFSEGRRTVQLIQGQAYFEVVKDSAHPFQVSTDDLTITVTGTAFNVDQLHQRVNVAEGSVQVSTAAGASANLAPGQGAVLSADTLQPHHQPATQVAAWRDDKLILRQERLADVIDSLRPYCDQRLLLRDSELGEQLVTGVYDLSAPEEALRAIIGLHGGTLRQLGPLLLIERG
ncbi:FecR family protein [Pseudomonas abyssi]|uniref:FecR family protein n=1 Tax=Pseudomonas abyssi TaxID=170540 RepID=UPI003C7DEBCF